MLTETQIIEREKKYFIILANLLEKNIGQFITQIYSQRFIIGAATPGISNIIEAAVENILEGIIAQNLHWNVCSMPVSSDSCFECGDAIIHIDAKTIHITDGDNFNNKVNVEKSQTTYLTGRPLAVSNKEWEPKLNLYEKHRFFGEVPNLTYIVKIVYSDNNMVETIKLISLPHGQLGKRFGYEKILNAGKTLDSSRKFRNNIRFLEDEIKQVDEWRIKTIFERKD